MKKTHSKQRGMSFWSLAFVLGFIGLVTLFALRAFPLYNQKFAATASMNTVSTLPGVDKMSKSKLTELVRKNFSINNVTAIHTNDVKKHLKVIKPKDASTPKKLQLKFDMENKLAADLFLKIQYEYEVPLKGPS